MTEKITEYIIQSVQARPELLSDKKRNLHCLVWVQQLKELSKTAKSITALEFMELYRDGKLSEGATIEMFVEAYFKLYPKKESND